MRYFIIFLLLLITEIAIAYFHFHPFIRYFVGDVLVIPLIFYFLKIFLYFSSERIAFGVLIFAFIIEVLQYFKIDEILGIHSKILRIIIGTTFSFYDLIAYVLGFGILLFSERIIWRINKSGLV